MKKLILIFSLVCLSGCAGGPLSDVGRAPPMSPLGAGLKTPAYPIPVTPPVRTPVSYHSLWDDGTDLYRDPRARRVGDVITVVISIQDKAKLDNNTQRSRDSQIKFGLDWLADVTAWQNKGQAGTDVNSQTSSKGLGQIDRKEDIQLSVAAIVTDVLPNGNLLISGSQEVRVNYEMRVLNVGGIVRPRDISRGNTVSYEKVAEARISYGGRGRLMDVQQPAWGHQVYDVVAPF